MKGVLLTAVLAVVAAGPLRAEFDASSNSRVGATRAALTSPVLHETLPWPSVEDVFSGSRPASAKSAENTIHLPPAPGSVEMFLWAAGTVGVWCASRGVKRASVSVRNAADRGGEQVLCVAEWLKLFRGSDVEIDFAPQDARLRVFAAHHDQTRTFRVSARLLTQVDLRGPPRH